jgi:cytochrome c oxidase assembly factor CtaG
VVGYLIAIVAFLLPLGFGATGLGRPRLVLGVGAVLAVGWIVSLVAGRAQDSRGHELVPVWFLGGLVVLLYVIWCGGLWLGDRLRRARS